MAMKESSGVLLRRSMRLEAGEVRAGEGAAISVMVKKALALVMKSGEEKFSMPVTTRWVGRMVMPGASMLTKVIIMAASGKGGVGRWLGLSFSSSSRGWLRGSFSWAERSLA